MFRNKIEKFKKNEPLIEETAEETLTKSFKRVSFSKHCLYYLNKHFLRLLYSQKTQTDDYY